MSGKRNRVRVRGKDRGKDHEEALKATSSCRASIFAAHRGIGSLDNLSRLLLRAQTQV